MVDSATVSVPATSANLGPGFDCLGLALELRNTFTFREGDAPLSYVVEGEGAGQLMLEEDGILLRAAKRVYDLSGRRLRGLHVTMQNAIPVGSGLGSSATAALAGILGVSALLNYDIDQTTALGLASDVEGHPDNVAPALLGGLTIAGHDDGQLWVKPVAIAPLNVVIILPDVNFATAAARAALPTTVAREDAVFNMSRLALLVSTLADGNYDLLRRAMADRLHQPYRLPLIPGMEDAFEAAYAAGAAGVALSGAGPSLMAIAPDHHQAISRAAQAAFTAVGLASRAWILTTAVDGARVEKGPAQA
ncbi:MAG: homoserine kinase [Candidatus Promineifilaceae bacterium]|nr:homoserine kinase [Candidatus Promineifilaceae bacterium]